ncbi:hypothetical protein EMIHUDRAFT_194430 [Emiliania huxleyi CCMP1516]|uniref:ARID domain-containing protein n=2 Tax=Emiliania huxleyi TaxID=2903 RepID=A0A0D3L1I0_EMIH1|nr:hypothetical protein EMIHUDRAFT_194430 [Emiliania huxleyi CCMP1516]EOD41865.1 hypothetical protein EMIHUDRAFT_194430 [Emiliania huxleyi CCMP1516]|eukprot:XP_005794294.1 hypothetical protein EMIHUDRAFT_194430 [Emiliania huxleyi CCMP1516]
MPTKRASSSAGAGAPASGSLDALRQSLVEAPTFTPTAAEFENPLRYLLSIREEAEKFGICAIQPPPSWKPPFMLDLNKLRFPTRVQKINELLVRKVQRLKFMKALTGFCDGRGTPLKKIPDVSGRAVDLHLLYTLVRKRGGFEQTCAARRWSEVAEQMNMHHAARSHLAQALKKHYHALLLPFERCEAGLDPPPAPKPSRGLKYSLPAVGEVVQLTGPKGVQRSNADVEEVIAYEPPAPGEELCEVCGGGEHNDQMLLCDRFWNIVTTPDQVPSQG